MRNITIDVSQQAVKYPIKIEKGLLKNVAKEISAVFKGQRIAIITDENVSPLYSKTVKNQLQKSGYEVSEMVLKPGEQTKTFESMPKIYNQLIENGISRSDLIIALGGGVIGDIAGFVAATFLRGISFVQIPTTLLAQVDSSVGGKVGVDLPEGKNLAGAFYHPRLVLVDPLVLETLSDSDFADGMAEVIKYGCIKDEGFFKHLETVTSRQELMKNGEELIETCCKIKQEVVQRDEKDTGERMLLNFGHTLGHAIESFYNYQKYTHGQAVAIGMVKITELAEEKGINARGTAERIKNCLIKHQLPTELDQPSDYPSIIPFIKKDKKQLNNHLYVVLLDTIGSSKRELTDYSFFKQLEIGG